MIGKNRKNEIELITKKLLYRRNAKNIPPKTNTIDALNTLNLGLTLKI